MRQLISNKDIDKKQWDNVVLHSSQGQIYALSSYLDIFFPKWKGLIWQNKAGKYLAVAPIFEKNFFFFKTCAQPSFIQQSGVYCLPEIEQTPYLQTLIDFLSKKYFKLNYSLNVTNSETEINASTSNRTNYILSIQEFSVSQLNSNRKRELKKTYKQNLFFKESEKKEFSKDQFLHYCSKLKSIKPKHLDKINRLAKSSLARVFEIMDEQNVVLSKVLVGEFKNKIYYLVPVNYNTLQKGISTRMIIELIGYYFDKKKIMDFEGGTVKNMAQFYQGFCSESQTYKVISK